MATKNTSIRFDEALHQRIVDYAKLTNKSVSAVVEEGMETYLVDKVASQPEIEDLHHFMDRFQPLMEKLKDK